MENTNLNNLYSQSYLLLRNIGNNLLRCVLIFYFLQRIFLCVFWVIVDVCNRNKIIFNLFDTMWRFCFVPMGTKMSCFLREFWVRSIVFDDLIKWKWVICIYTLTLFFSCFINSCEIILFTTYFVFIFLFSY